MPTTTANLTHRRCMCSGCGEVFSCAATFDKHRKGGKCLDPASVGLEIKIGPVGSWWGGKGDFRPRKGETLTAYRYGAKTPGKSSP